MSDTAPTETPVAAEPTAAANAVAADNAAPVTPPADPFADEFTFESTVEKKYPLCPEGVQKVIVDKAIFEMRDNFQKTAKVPTVSLWLSTLDAKYKDPGTDEERGYRLFKTLKVSDHAKSNMFEFFQKVMGTPVPLKEVKNADGTTAKRIYIGPRSVEKVEGGEGEEEIRYKQFENLEFQVTVAHETKDDGTKKDGVDSIIASSPEQKAANAKMFATE